MDVRRAAFRLTEIFDYRTFAVAGAFGTLMIVGFLVYSSAQTAHNALDAQQASGRRASRRIDGLQRIIAEQAQRIADNSVENARLREGQEALARQVQLMGGQPVVTPSPGSRVYVVASPEPEPEPAAPPAQQPSHAPRPSTAPRPSPRPSPSPTCRAIPVLGCVGR